MSENLLNIEVEIMAIRLLDSEVCLLYLLSFNGKVFECLTKLSDIRNLCISFIQLQAGQLDSDDVSLCSTDSGDDIAGIYKILL
jgi:hypothetical protein